MNENGMYLYEFHQFLKGSIDTIIQETKVPETVIEVGLYQGYFTFNMTHLQAESNPNYKHYAIDPYTGCQDLDKDMIDNAYKCFQHNLSVSPYSKNIEFINKSSWNGLLELLNRNVKADLIYIDGSHTSDDVLQDIVLSWNLLKTGGVILLDDATSWCYTDKNGEKALQYSPRLAVDAFIHCNWGKIEVINLPSSYQTAFIKRS